MLKSPKLRIKNWQPLVADKGVIALITSIVVGLLLVVITSGAITIMSLELRQASDYDQSVKAYFAAQSGVEDAINYINRQLKTGASMASLSSPGCDTYSATDANLGTNVSYSCQIVSVDQNQISGDLQAEEGVQIDLSGIDANRFNKLVISWSQTGSSDPQSSDPAIWKSTPAPGSTSPPLFPAGTSWNGKYPAVMETTIINYPTTATFSSGAISQHGVIFKPSVAGSFNQSYNAAAATPVPIKCTPGVTAGDYECQATFTGFDNSNYFVARLLARYSATHYKVEAFQGSTLIAIPGSQLSIDVTGNAGGVLRRIRVQIPVASQSKVPFALLADDTICKVLEVTDPNTASSETGCN